MHGLSSRMLMGGAAGVLAGVLAGIGMLSISAAGARPAGQSVPPSARLFAGAHLPPLLTRPGEPVTLHYALVCAPREDGLPCAGAGDVFIRVGQSGGFTRLPLQRGDDSKEGRYFVEVPPAIAGSPAGFSYYATLRDHETGETLTLPSGGPAAPQRSLQLDAAVDVALGPHSFGHVRHADARAVEAPWGSGAGQLGLAGSKDLGRFGPSAFDVDANGGIAVLDQVNGRLSRWNRGGVPVATTAVKVDRGLADLALEPDGTIDVLEPPSAEHHDPSLKSFRPNGSLRWAQQLSDRTWAKLARGPSGPVVLQDPSEQWLPVADHGAPHDRGAQARAAHAGRPLGSGRELLVERVGSDELRIAETAGTATVRAWRVTSATSIGEVQLAERLGARLLVVVKTYTDERDEFTALVLDHSGVSQQFSLTPSQWAETAPLARFRLAGTSLYQLGSTEAGAFVDRYDLEVTQ